MADLTISGLPAVAAGGLLTQQIPVNEGGTTKRLTVAQALATALGVATNTYGAAMSTDMTAGQYQTVSLAGAVTSWATANRAAGMSVRLLIKAAIDAVFARASAAYDPYTGAASASGVARYPQPGVNLLKFSEDFTNAVWTKGNASVTPNATTAPDKKSMACNIQEDATNGNHYLSLTPFTAGSTGCLSVYVKANGRNVIFFQMGNGVQAYFTLSGAGTTSNVAGGCTATIVYVGDGWYRCTAALASIPTNGDGIIYLAAVAGTASYQGDGTSGVYLWGAQAELSAAPTAYNPTGTAYPGCGLMVEEGATNRALWSDDLTNAAWQTSIGGAGVPPVTTANFAAAPDGTATATRIQLSIGAGVAAGDICVMVQTIAGLANPHTTSESIWLKSNTGLTYSIGLYNNATGARSQISVTPTWQLFKLENQVVAGVNDYIQFGLVGNEGSAKTADLLAWRAHDQAGAYVTSGIKTTTAAATRAAETETIPASVMNQPAWTIDIAAYWSGDKCLANCVGSYIICGGPSSGANSWYIQRYGTVLRASLSNGAPSTSLASGVCGAVAPGLHIVSLSVNAGTGSASLFLDGVKLASYAGGAVPSVTSSLVGVGTDAAADTWWNDPIRYVAVYKSTLDDPTMAANGNIHDPSVPARLQANADYFIDYSANGGNQAPARAITLNPAWHVVGVPVRPTVLPSGKQARLLLEAFGTTEADIVATYIPETA